VRERKVLCEIENCEMDAVWKYALVQEEQFSQYSCNSKIHSFMLFVISDIAFH
jgi:hypothetical protein